MCGGVLQEDCGRAARGCNGCDILKTSRAWLLPEAREAEALATEPPHHTGAWNADKIPVREVQRSAR